MIKFFENFQIDLNIYYELWHLDKYNHEEELFLSERNVIDYNPYDLVDMYNLFKKYQKEDNTVFLRKITIENLYSKDLDFLMKSNKYNL